MSPCLGVHAVELMDGTPALISFVRRRVSVVIECEPLGDEGLVDAYFQIVVDADGKGPAKTISPLRLTIHAPLQQLDQTALGHLANRLAVTGLLEFRTINPPKSIVQAVFDEAV